jgi:hypothetical protein
LGGNKKSEVEMGERVADVWVMVGVWDRSSSEVCFRLVLEERGSLGKEPGIRRGGRRYFMGELLDILRTG